MNLLVVFEDGLVLLNLGGHLGVIFTFSVGEGRLILEPPR